MDADMGTVNISTNVDGKGLSVQSGDRDEIGRIHERFDDLANGLSRLEGEIIAMKAACQPCQEMIRRHNERIDGNGKLGYEARIAKLESGRTDTITISSAIKLMGAGGGLLAALATAVGTILSQAIK